MYNLSCNKTAPVQTQIYFSAQQLVDQARNIVDSIVRIFCTGTQIPECTDDINTSKENVLLRSTDSAGCCVYNYGGITITDTCQRGVEVNESLMRSMEALRDIELLQDNWNKNGAKAFSKTLIKKCRHLVETLRQQPYVFPTAQDSIQFEWESEDAGYLEIELFENGECVMGMRKNDGNWIEGPIEYEEIGDYVERFTAGTI